MLKECGRTNFAMSSGAMFAAIFSAMLYKEYGTIILLSLEFFLTFTSILLLTTLPNPPSARPHAKTIKERATIRSKASQYSKRITDLPVGVVLYLDGRKGDFYKIQEK